MEEGRRIELRYPFSEVSLFSRQLDAIVCRLPNISYVTYDIPSPVHAGPLVDYPTVSIGERGNDFRVRNSL